MEEITVNIHNHSLFSDGSGSYHEIAQAGLTAGVDCLIMTDHNVYVQGKDSYYYRDGKKLLMLVGEEIHNPQGEPGSHLLVLNPTRELANLSANPQMIIDAMNRDRGITVIAHPFEYGNPKLRMNSYSWHNWDVHDYTGLEIYNFMSEFKNNSQNIVSLIRNYLNPQDNQLGANEMALNKWDELLCQGRRILAFAGSDAHRMIRKIGFFKIVAFEYEFHFRALNNHVNIPNALSGDVASDKSMVMNALKSGNFYVGLDIISPAKGFRFTANTDSGIVNSGTQVLLGNSATLQISIPQKCLCRLICNGTVYKQWDGVQSIPVTVTTPGYYRVECYLPYRNKLRGWIYSNPIYLYRG